MGANSPLVLAKDLACLLDPSNRPAGGFTQIPNVLLDALCAPRLTDRERRTLLAVIRQTLGYHRAVADIAVSTLAKMTGVGANHISVAIKALVKKRVLLSEKGRYGQVLGIRLPSLWFGGVAVSAVGVDAPCPASASSRESEATDSGPIGSSETSQMGSGGCPDSGIPDSQIRTGINTVPSKEGLKDSKNLVQADASTTVGVGSGVDDFGFDRFWDAFADKRGRKAALAIWRFMAPSPALADRIVSAAERYAAYRQAVILPSGRCGAMAKSWLDGERWEDEVPVTDWTEDERALIDGFNRELGASMPVVEGWTPQRGALVRGALAVWTLDRWLRFFAYVRENCRFGFPAGFDWLLRNREQVAEGLYHVEGVEA